MEQARAPGTLPAFAPVVASTPGALSRSQASSTLASGPAGACLGYRGSALVLPPVLLAMRQVRVLAALPATGAAAAAPGRLPPARGPVPPQTVPGLCEGLRQRPLERRQLIEAFVEGRIDHALQRSQLAGTPVRLEGVADLAQALGGDAATAQDVAAVMDALVRWQHRLPPQEVAALVATLVPRRDPNHDLRHAPRWDHLLRPMYWPAAADRDVPSFLECLCDRLKDPAQRVRMASHLVRQIVGVPADPAALSLPMAQRVRLRRDALETFLRQFGRLGPTAMDPDWLTQLADEIGGGVLRPPERIGLMAALLAPRPGVTPDQRSIVAARCLANLPRQVQAGVLGGIRPGSTGIGEMLRLLVPCIRPTTPEGGLATQRAAAMLVLRSARLMHPCDIGAAFALLQEAGTPPAGPLIGTMDRAFVQEMVGELGLADAPRARAMAAGLFADVGGGLQDLSLSDARTAMALRIEQRLRDLLALFQAHHEPWTLGVVVYEAARAARRLVDDGPSMVGSLVRAIAEVGAAFPPARQRLMMYALAVAWDRIDPQAQDRWSGFDAALDEAVQQEAVRNEPLLAPLVAARVTRMHASIDDEARLLVLACRVGDPDTHLAEQVARAERIAPPSQRFFLHQRITGEGLFDLPHDSGAAFPPGRFEAWQRANMAQLADFDLQANDPLSVVYEVHRPGPAVPGAPVHPVVPPFDQRLQGVRGSYLRVESMAGLFHIHKLADDMGSRAAAQGARAGLEAARRRIGQRRTDAWTTLAGRPAAATQLINEIEREHAIILRALRLADGGSAGAMDAIDAS